MRNDYNAFTNVKI